MTKKVLIARSAGFCFGVKRAIAIADETAGKGESGDGKEGPIQSLGPIIHNPQAVERLQEKGVRVVESVDEIACGKVIVRSHGVTRSDRAALDARIGTYRPRRHNRLYPWRSGTCRTSSGVRA